MAVWCSVLPCVEVWGSVAQCLRTSLLYFIPTCLLLCRWIPFLYVTGPTVIRMPCLVRMCKIWTHDMTESYYSQSHLGCHFRKLRAQSSKVSFATFQWKETFELWALSFATAFQNVTPSRIGCTSYMWQDSQSYEWHVSFICVRYEHMTWQSHITSSLHICDRTHSHTHRHVSFICVRHEHMTESCYVTYVTGLSHTGWRRLIGSPKW